MQSSPGKVYVEVEKLGHVVHEDSQLILGDSVHRLDRLDTGPALRCRCSEINGWEFRWRVRLEVKRREGARNKRARARGNA